MRGRRVGLSVDWLLAAAVFLLPAAAHAVPELSVLDAGTLTPMLPSQPAGHLLSTSLVAAQTTLTQPVGTQAVNGLLPMTLTVASTAGFPSTGTIAVGTEDMGYTVILS